MTTDNKYYDPKRIEEIQRTVITITPHCKSCIYYDKLLNVCFHNSQQWKQVWDETEACEKWDNNPEHSLEE